MKILDYSLRLLIVCVVSSGLLAFVYDNTSQKIAANIEKEKITKVKEVLPKSVNRIKEDKLGDSTYYKGYNNANFIGLAIVSSSRGYGGNINLLVGIDKQGKIINVAVLSHKETPGLGAKIEEPKFIGQFRDKTKNEISLKKDSSQGEIDAIAAATISSRAFTNAIKNAYKTFEQVMISEK